MHVFIITDESLNFWMERVTNEIALFSKRCILDHSAWNYKSRFMSTFPYKWLNVDLYSMKYSMVGTSISFLNVQSGLAKTKTQRKTIRWFWTVQYNTIDIRLYSRVYNSEKVENLPFKWFIWGKKKINFLRDNLVRNPHGTVLYNDSIRDDSHREDAPYFTI